MVKHDKFTESKDNNNKSLKNIRSNTKDNNKSSKNIGSNTKDNNNKSPKNIGSNTKGKKSSNTKGDNKFSENIKFREGEPIRLLDYNKDPKDGKNFGQIVLNPKALDILRTINEPLAIISVVGSCHRRKSWFANVLHGRHDGFDSGTQVKGTRSIRGIYMWSTPFKLESKQSDDKIIQKRVIVLDSEGINNSEQDQNLATKLFILCLIISSTFIYNINDDDNDMGQLCLMKDLNKFIQESEFSTDFLPRLIILLHDFNFDGPKRRFVGDYFLEKLNEVNPEAANGILEYFNDLDVYGLPPLRCGKKLTQPMRNVITNQLDKNFVNQVENVVKGIYSQLSLKYIGSSTMIGITFVKFLRDTIECMNSSEKVSLLSIPFKNESIIQEAMKEAIEVYKEEMNLNLLEEKLPILWEEFEEIHCECISEANKLFFKIIESPTQIESYAKQLNEKIFKVKEEFTKKNSGKLMAYNENIAKDFWKRFVENSEGVGFEEALEKFELAYEDSKIRSPEAVKVHASYIKNKYSTSQLRKMNVQLEKEMRAKEEAERSRLEALVREEESCKNFELQKRELENKLSESQSNMKQQQQSCKNFELQKHELENKLSELQSNMKQQQSCEEIKLKNKKKGSGCVIS